MTHEPGGEGPSPNAKELEQVLQETVSQTKIEEVYRGWGWWKFTFNPCCQIDGGCQGGLPLIRGKNSSAKFFSA